MKKYDRNCFRSSSMNIYGPKAAGREKSALPVKRAHSCHVNIDTRAFSRKKVDL
jgi:hypothetical protein